LLSETFLIALQRSDACRAVGERERVAWLYSIAASRLGDHYRRSASERRASERLAREWRPADDEELARIEKLGEELDGPALEAFDGLSVEQRDAVRLRVLEGRGYPAVSRKLGITEPAARARVSRGLRAMRRAIVGEREEQ
jgi:RNA polymerase sigma-70 factor (ECF subfamily)